MQQVMPGVGPSIGKAKGPAVVVLSGGQDSVTCLGVAFAAHADVHAISFAYGQKHVVELEQAAIIARMFGFPHQIVNLDFLATLVTSELTKPDGDTSKPHAYKPGLPASFVPNRNALFLTIAHALAQEIGAHAIYTGVCQTDYSGYPDCREEFVLELESALNIGYQTDIQIHTPLMNLTKAETFALAATVGFLDVVLESSHTCYNGDRRIRHEWGYGCGVCPACQLRMKGWKEYQATNA